MMNKFLITFSFLIFLDIGADCQDQNQIADTANNTSKIEGLWHLTGCISYISPCVYNVQPVFFFDVNGIGGRILPMPYCDTLPFKYSILDTNINVAFDDTLRQNILFGCTYFSFEIVENKKGIFLKLLSTDKHYTFVFAKQD